MQCEYIVSMDCLPYYAGTAGASAPSSWSPAADEPRGAALLRDAIVHTRWAWSDRLRVTEGELDADGLTVELHDLEPSAGFAQGQKWLTLLSTRDALEIPSAIVEASFSAAAMSFTVSTGSASALSPAIPGVVWVDDEAILCSAINLGTGVVTVDTGGRGYYGSRARAHTVDAESGAYPEAWVAPAWATRRRVLLWRVGTDGVARVIRRLYANRAPRLSKNRASYELQCEHAWTVERGRALGAQTAFTRLRGFNAAGLQLRVIDPQGAWVGAQNMSSWQYADGFATIYDTLDELLTGARGVLAQSISTYGSVTQVAVYASRVGREVSVRGQITGLSSAASLAALVLGEETRGSNGDGGASPLRLEVSFTAPEVAVVLDVSAARQTIPVNTTSGLPSSPASAIYAAHGPHVTSLRQVLAGEYDEHTRLVVDLPAADAFDSDYAGPVVTGRVTLQSIDTGRPLPPRTGVRGLTGDAGNAWHGARVVTVDRAVPLALSVQARTTHWAYGLCALVENGDAVGCRVDPRTWAWDALDDVVLQTESELSDRVWMIDSKRTLGELITPTLAAEGCCPAPRAFGRIELVALRHPRANEVPVASYDSDDLVRGPGFEWTALPEGLVNAATVKNEDLTVTVRDARSVQRYGEGRAHQIELDGLPPGVAADPFQFASRLLSRVVQLWGDPVALVRFRVPVSRADDVYPGSFVALTDAVVPNGLGGRGMAQRMVQVTSVALDQTNPASSFVALEGVTFPVCYAYAPAIRVASISGAVLTAAAGYVLAGSLDATDYAGLGGTDRGVSRFTAGDRGKLLLRDSTTYTYLSAVVLGVDDSTGEITLTASVPTTPTDWPAFAVSGWVDFVFDDYETAGMQAEQKLYAFGGNGNSAFGGIGASGDKSRRWAP